MLKDRYKNLQKLIGVKFKDYELLDRAFIHKSYVNEHKKQGIKHNERLEFLGDAVLELVTTDYLFKTNPEKEEGILTNWRSALVKGEQLAKVAEELQLGNYLYLSRGEEKSGGRKKRYLLANVMEAVIGAMYLDRGYKTAQNFINKFILTKLPEILEKGLHIDAKSKFQELSQEKLSITPKYKLISEVGPDHDKKFKMGVYLKDELIAEGTGTSKNNAEQKAALNALKIKGWE